jgi:predicted secreted protein
MSNKKTAVEWLVEQICGDHTEQWQKEIEQAKEMEKQQIIDAFNNGEFFPSDYYHANNPNVDGSETYYNKTYGGDK